MSTSINVKDIEAIIDSFVKKGVEYTVALYPFIPSSDKERHENVIDTLRPAFGEAFRYLNVSSRVWAR
jgi:MoaA/NifB/PqqE/SkfB family radical SAM enzyme